jgi:hypothetical protein
LKRLLALCSALVAVPSATASGARPTTEFATTVGYSTQGTAAVATQLRVFGEMRPGLRFYAEATGAGHTGRDSDAFAAAYAYENGLQASETYLEQQLPSGRAMSGLRVGRYRTPFGIYNGSDYAYNGFLRPPLIRYGYYRGVSNYWIEGGVDYFIGPPQLQLEASLGTPQEADKERHGVDAALRIQGYRGPVILGASYLTTHPSAYGGPIHGSGHYTGVDARWMQSGLQLHGEWIHGANFAGARSSGWYIDALAHRRGLGPVTPVLRYEEYRFSMPGEKEAWRRWTVGARVRITPSLAASLNLIHGWNGAFDVGVTHTVRF